MPALSLAAVAHAEVAAYQIACVYAYRGETGRAFEWLERAYRQRDPGLGWSKEDFFLQTLHSDPRWPAFMKKLGVADERVVAPEVGGAADIVDVVGIAAIDEGIAFLQDLGIFRNEPIDDGVNGDGLRRGKEQIAAGNHRRHRIGFIRLPGQHFGHHPRADA